MKIACCILAYNITKGMKSFGPIGLLKKNNRAKELVLYQIEYVRKIFGNVEIYVITGFGKDKLDKKIAQKKSVNIIHNDAFDSKNHGYAFKLLLNCIKNKLSQYSGILFIDSHVLIKSLKNKKRNCSWIIAKPHKLNHSREDFLGVNINDNNIVQSLFYNIGHLGWCNSFYLTQRDILTIIQNIGVYHDHMFLFEILNQSVDNFGIQLGVNVVSSSNKEIIEINGIRDKYKVK